MKGICKALKAVFIGVPLAVLLGVTGLGICVVTLLAFVAWALAITPLAIPWVVCGIIAAATKAKRINDEYDA